jgi:tetratricopeptide (TPR) repeat protein
MPGDLNDLQRSASDLARLQKAQAYLSAGRYVPALATYRELTTRFPLVAELWFELGSAAAGELDFTLASSAFKRSADLATRNASLLVLIGKQYLGLRQTTPARECFEGAVAADPASVDARISLAMWFEKERELEKARAEVESILVRQPRDDQARYFRALLLHREKRHSEAETVLRDLIKDDPQYPYVQYASRHLLGLVLDDLGQYAGALSCLADAKARLLQFADITSLQSHYDNGENQRRRLLAALTPDMIKNWQQQPFPTDFRFRMAFLGGHPRSGTTLLEQMLDAHPGLLAFDEPLAFNRHISADLPLPGGSGKSQADSLHAFKPVRVKVARERYLRSILNEASGEPSVEVLLDKNPSLTAFLPHWLRVFPQLKVIIALRDPRDVVLSCYFLNLVLNATNVNFLSLERTAKHYADLMDTWLRMRELGGFDWREIRYEDIVRHPEAGAAQATEFLGLSWQEGQGRFYETARQKFLFAPTYHDVRQPVYGRAIGRWKNYATALEPLQAKLAPYCEALGYAL